MKKIWAIMMALLMVFPVASCSGRGIRASGRQDDVDWVFYDNGELEISGWADMGNPISSDTYDWSNFQDYITKVTIKEGVMNVAAGAFSDCENLERVDLPYTITEIGRGAFSDCSKLTKIVLPENVEIIRDFAFAHCPNLSSINIPEKVDEIGYGAFGNRHDGSDLSDIYYAGTEEDWQYIFGVEDIPDEITIHYNS